MSDPLNPSIEDANCGTSHILGHDLQIDRRTDAGVVTFVGSLDGEEVCTWSSVNDCIQSIYRIVEDRATQEA